MALGSNAVHKLWKWQKKEQNEPVKVLLIFQDPISDNIISFFYF